MRSWVGTPDTELDDRGLVHKPLERTIVKPEAIEVHLTAPERTEVMQLPWTVGRLDAKGIIHTPTSEPTISDEDRDALLLAIAKARRWVDELAKGRIEFSDIARREGKVERHIRLLSQLAFVSPMIVDRIAAGTIADIKITELAKAAVPSWAEQSSVLAIC